MPVRDVVALDGPSGTGKSTVARALAARLGLRYLDTGAMYRAVAWAVLEEGVDPHDAAAVTRLASRLALDIGVGPDDQHVSVDGRPVQGEIRSAPVTVAVSPVSAIPAVRRLLVDAQRRLIGAGGIVVEGRDIGTVVAADAPLKVFLTASPDARAHRRARQEGVGAAEVDATAEALHRRDTYDTSRAVSPLRAAEDAVHVDTTAVPIDEVVESLVDLARGRGIAVVHASPVRKGDQP